MKQSIRELQLAWPPMRVWLGKNFGTLCAPTAGSATNIGPHRLFQSFLRSYDFGNEHTYCGRGGNHSAKAVLQLRGVYPSHAELISHCVKYSLI